MFDQVLQARLAKYKAKGLYRTRRILPAEIVNFSSNDYLGLSKHPALVETYSLAAHRYGVGSGASKLVCGYSEAHEELELAFAKFLNRDRAILFSNGYMANLGVMQALMQRGDRIYQDKLNHASLIDASFLTRSEMQRYQHVDVNHLEKLLSQQSNGHKLIVTDGVFSMQGNMAPLNELSKLAKKYHAWLMVDDAHGIGFVGQGRGSVAAFNLSQEEVPILVCPLGKAFGGFGAIVAGSHSLIESLIQFARTYIYTTAIPPALAAAMNTSLTLIQSEPWRQAKLYDNVNFFKQVAKQYQLPILPSDTAIQCVLVQDSEKALAISQALIKKGFYLSAIRPPTVPEGTARLRITLNTDHDKNQILALLGNLKEAFHVAS